MNIFEEYIKKITQLIEKNKNLLQLNELKNFQGVTVELPPTYFNFDFILPLCQKNI